MDFVIQASHPRAIAERSADDASLSDALQTVFPLYNEAAILVWNGVYVPLDYKYDLSVMIQDLLDLLSSILESPSGAKVVDWPSNTFAARWRVEWSGSMVSVRADWRTVVGGTEALLQARPEVSLSTSEFTSEWKMVLENAERALVGAGYQAEDLPELLRLRAVLAMIPEYGRCYRA